MADTNNSRDAAIKAITGHWRGQGYPVDSIVWQGAVRDAVDVLLARPFMLNDMLDAADPDRDDYDGWRAVCRVKDSMIRSRETALSALVADDGPCDEALRHLNPNEGCGYETYRKTWGNLRAAVVSARAVLDPMEDVNRG